MSKIKLIIVLFTIALCSCTTINTDETQMDEDIANIDIELFMNIDEIELETDFIKQDVFEGNKLKSYSINGSYDFDCNGKIDLANFVIKFRDRTFKKSVLQINDSSIECEFYNPNEIYVIDLDSKDKFVEFAIYDDGPSGDPSFTFYRYTGKEILLLGEVSGYPKYDSNGQMITSSANFVCPEIVFEIAEVVDNKIIFTDIDYTQYLNKELIVCYDFNAYFKEYDTIPENFIPLYDIEETLIAKDSTIKLKHIEFLGSVPYWYEVELDNGVNGILYFWLGD